MLDENVDSRVPGFVLEIKCLFANRDRDDDMNATGRGGEPGSCRERGKKASPKNFATWIAARDVGNPPRRAITRAVSKGVWRWDSETNAPPLRDEEPLAE